MKHTLIPEDQLCKLPFLYKHIEKPQPVDMDRPVQEMPHIAGSITDIQNADSRLETFYKCISRF